ncbi:MAG TPA: metallophosphoesterase, partial [bacterium]|nr:metallophosphoesterase [bacterium]
TKELDDGTDVQFFALDTMQMLLKKNARKKQLEWLEDQLEESKAYWKIVFAHHPVYAGGKHGDTEEFIKWIEPLLIQYGVDLYVSGHEHVLAAVKPVFGVDYLISGAGAAPSAASDAVRRPQDLFMKATLGFAIIRISRENIEIEMRWGKNGRILYEYIADKEE